MSRNICIVLSEIKNPTVLLNQLAKAIKQKDVPELSKIIAECEILGYPELNSELRRARINLEDLGGGDGGLQKFLINILNSYSCCLFLSH